jgi:hypothetical protein
LQPLPARRAINLEKKRRRAEIEREKSLDGEGDKMRRDQCKKVVTESNNHLPNRFTSRQ